MEDKYVNEKNWQKFRKFFLVLGIIGPFILIGGIVLIILGTVVFPDVYTNNFESWPIATRPAPVRTVTPNFAFLMPGAVMAMFGLMMTIIGWTMYYKRQITGAMVAGTMPVATGAINQGAQKITPAIQAITKSIQDAKKGEPCNTEELLANAKSLKDRGLIDEEEYKEMRKSILSIK